MTILSLRVLGCYISDKSDDTALGNYLISLKAKSRACDGIYRLTAGRKLSEVAPVRAARRRELLELVAPLKTPPAARQIPL